MRSDLIRLTLITLTGLIFFSMVHPGTLLAENAASGASGPVVSSDSANNAAGADSGPNSCHKSAKKEEQQTGEDKPAGNSGGPHVLPKDPIQVRPEIQERDCTEPRP